MIPYAISLCLPYLMGLVSGFFCYLLIKIILYCFYFMMMIMMMMT